MALNSHNIFDNVRTRVIVIHQGCLLLLEPRKPGDGWRLPGGGMEPNESLADCAEREILEETGLHVRAARVAFLREWVVPRYCPTGKDEMGFGMEVYLYAALESPQVELRVEFPGGQAPHWVPLERVPDLPLWPKELKTLARQIAAGEIPQGVPSFVSQLESPLAPGPEDIRFV